MYTNGLKAEQQPRRYLSLILDGVDQSNTNLPPANCLSKVSLQETTVLQKKKSTPSWRSSSLFFAFFFFFSAFIISEHKVKYVWFIVFSGDRSYYVNIETVN